MRDFLFALLTVLFLQAPAQSPCEGTAAFEVLHFTKTNGFNHNTRDESAQLFSNIGDTSSFTIVDTEDASAFDDLSVLEDYEVVIFSNTSGNNLLNATQQANLEAYIDGGGAFLGIHAATDTYRNGSWPFYNDLVGAIVQSGPNHTSANHMNFMDQIEPDHPTLVGIPDPWEKREEYYYWELNGGQLSPNIQELLRVRQTGSNSYDEERPITWHQEFGNGGRSFYTALGHHQSDYLGSDQNNAVYFQQLLANAVCWCAGSGPNVVSVVEINLQIESLGSTDQLNWHWPGYVPERVEIYAGTDPIEAEIVDVLIGSEARNRSWSGDRPRGSLHQDYYYRLGFYDTDGVSTFSPWVRIDPLVSTGPQLLTDQSGNRELIIPMDSRVTEAHIFDVFGRLVGSFRTSAGRNPLNTDGLYRGTYTIIFDREDVAALRFTKR